MNKQVDIIVPIYNKEKYLSRCMESLLGQTYPNIKIILVDDGSTDDSLRLCREYEKRDKRVQVISKTNGGVSSARNAGLEMCTGELVTFVDPDDSIEKTMLAELVEVLEENDADISCCYAMDIYSDRKMTNSKNTGKRYLLQASKYAWNESYTHAVCWGAIYRKKIVERIRFDTSLAVGEDTLFFAQCVKRSNRIVSLDKALYRYYINEDSVTFGSWSEKKQDEMLAWERIIELFSENPQIERTAKAACGARYKGSVSRYCNDPLFMKNKCEQYKERYKCYAGYLIYDLLRKKHILTALKALYTLLFWNRYISGKQKEVGLE